MWLRTIMNYQYKNGGNIKNTFKTLYNQGGIFRFYQGYVPALMIGPISRFGDTFVNTLSLELFNGNDKFKNTPIFVQTMFASILAGIWRISTLPIDSWKTSKQVYGKNGIMIIKNKYHKDGIKSLYQGAMASSLATIVGHYPWFLTYNYLNSYLPKYKYDENITLALIRNASIGFFSSAISDTVSNSIRVVKTVKQTNTDYISYKDIVKNIIKKDGMNGLLFRGLETKILTNGIQGIVFSIFYKFFQEKFNK
jgi:hypothetical protein